MKCCEVPDYFAFFGENLDKVGTFGMITISDSSYVCPRITVVYIEFVALIPCRIHNYDRQKQEEMKRMLQQKLDNRIGTATSKETSEISKRGVIVPNKKY